MTANARTEAPPDRLLNAILGHVPFDGWSAASFAAAARDAGVGEDAARRACPRGALDLAASYHKRCDAKMREALSASGLEAMKLREKVAFAVRKRIEAVESKEAARRGMTLFALPQNAPEGARLVWGTADAIWNARGDRSDDVNWYTKRAILSGVYSSTTLYWLGDGSAGDEATWAFLNRRIENVMQFEKMKAQVRDNPVMSKLLAGPNRILSGIKAPGQTPRMDMPGFWDSQSR